MADALGKQSMEIWLSDVRSHVVESGPEVLALLDIYIGEACFGRQYVDAELGLLPSGASILEVGAGAMLLSCQFQREGFVVTALEPIGNGFAHFVRMQELVFERAHILGCAPRILDRRAEDLSEADQFDFAFSVNVMEHVQDVSLCIGNVCTSIRLGGLYRFACPTFFSKRLTEKLLGAKIFGGKNPAALRDTRNSLNWINVLQIRRAVAPDPALKLEFNRAFLISTLERVQTDAGFSSRRSGWIKAAIGILIKLHRHHFVRLVPAMCQPVIDCTIRRSVKGVA